MKPILLRQIAELSNIKMLSTLKGLHVTYMLMAKSLWNKVFHEIAFVDKHEYLVKCRTYFQNTLIAKNSKNLCSIITWGNYDCP